MQVVFLKETDKDINGLAMTLKRLICKIEKQNNKTYVIPINEKTKIKNKMIDRIIKKVFYILDNEETNTVVLSDYLGKNQYLKNKLYSENINILDGRLLFKCLSMDVLQYILRIKKQEMNSAETFILVNDFNETNKEIIIDIAKNIKLLNIITNNINRFKRIEKKLYNEYGIILSVLNNKRISLLNANIIINFDFPEELINQYRINKNAIIINTAEKIKIRSKKFNGININYFNINIPNNEKRNGFNDQEVYESKIINKPYNQIVKKIQEDKIVIKNLIGNKGVILEEQFNKFS